jgi:hypothetical protein
LTINWTNKTTTVTTHDEKAGTTFSTVYSYSPLSVGAPPDVNYVYGSQIPLEQSVTYNGPSGAILKKVNEKWFNQYELATKQTTLYNAQSQPSATNLTAYTYYPRAQLKEEDDYDFGNTTTALKKTLWTYQTFPGTPLYPHYPSIVDRPCSVMVENGSSAPYAETDYLYDGETTPCGTLGTPAASSASVPSGTHDETNYGPNASTARGNATSVTTKCLQSCISSTTTHTYDGTGQVVSMKDPCGNAACSDMTGTNHSTTYSYSDNPWLCPESCRKAGRRILLSS